MKLKPDHIFLICAVLAVLVHFFMPVKQIISYPYNLTGILIIIAGVGLTTWANSVLLKHKTSIQPYQTPTAFVTTGPFQFSRNPVYLGMAMMLSGLAILLQSLFGFITPIVFAVIINKFFVPPEERYLAKQFGNAYRSYKKNVRRWI